MSRSNNTESFNPCVRWMEWNGSKGGIKYYDKTQEKNIELPFGLTFIVLDQLATVKGWNDASDSGIFSNEVKDIVKEPLVVKSFKGGLIASGFYRDIKDKISTNGGHFTSNVYIACKIDGELKIASIQFKGAALNSWIEFAKKNRSELYNKAVEITGVEEGKKGAVTFQVPVFGLKEVAPETNTIAIALDEELQDHLKKYFAKTATEQVSAPVEKEVENIPVEAYVSKEHVAGKIEPNIAFKGKQTYTEHIPDNKDGSDDLPF